MAWTSLVYDQFIISPSSVTFMFILPKQMFQKAVLPQGSQLCQILLKSMHKCESYGPDKPRQMHARRYTEVVISMSLSLQAGLTKIIITAFIKAKIHCKNKVNLGVCAHHHVCSPFLKGKNFCDILFIP